MGISKSILGSEPHAKERVASGDKRFDPECSAAALASRPVEAVIMDPSRSPIVRRIVRDVAAALLVASLAACAVLRAPGGLPLGTPIAEARQAYGGASGEYALPGGGTRLEFRQGSFGRQTYMLDFDAGGRLVATHQVLTPTAFATITPGMGEKEVLARIGRPAFVFPVGWQQLQVWNYRFGGLEGDCVVFQVSISNATHTVAEAGPNTDPACDHGGDRS